MKIRDKVNIFSKKNLIIGILILTFYVLISNPKSMITNMVTTYAKITKNPQPPETVTIGKKNSFIVSSDDYIQMTQKTAVWASTITHALNNRDHKIRAYDIDFIYSFFNNLIAEDFESWTVHSPFGEKVWAGKEKYMDKEDGYIPYNMSFANNANHTITSPAIHYSGENKAIMYLNALNRTVDRWISDNRVPMWSMIIYWEKNGESWQIIGGKSFYESSK
ncbi:MAG: hypothetical protein ACPGXZ_13595 [Saprospiraceae bacterium]